MIQANGYLPADYDQGHLIQKVDGVHDVLENGLAADEDNDELDLELDLENDDLGEMRVKEPETTSEDSHAQQELL